MTDIVLRGLRKSFGGIEVIGGIDLEVRRGEFVVFVGPSGCGKSTLLRMIAGLEDITAGDLLIGGHRCNDLPPKARGVAMVFQSYALYPHKTVRGNMAFALRVAGLPRAEIARRVEAAAATLEIGHLLDRRPSQLSGGQRQRVAIGRAIVREPVAFLFDEPLSNLDAALRGTMRLEIARLHRALGATTIYVTHDQVEAMTLADRIVVLDRGVARQVGSPLGVYQRPADLFTAGFLGSPRMNLLRAEVAGSDGTGLTLRGPALGSLALPPRPGGAALPAGTAVTVGVRPEDLWPAGDAPEAWPRLRGRIDMVERLGATTNVALRLDDGTRVMAIAPPGYEAGLDAAAELALRPGAAHVFGPDGRSV